MQELFHIALQPVSTNNLTRATNINGRPLFFPTKQAKEFKQECVAQLKAMQISPCTGAVSLTIHWVPANRRGKSDLDNRLKSFIDCLVDAGIIEDDQWVFSIHAVKLPPDKNKHGIYFDVKSAEELPTLDAA